MTWNFDDPLNDALVTVETRHDDWGTFEIRIGTIPTIITIELGRHMNSDQTKVSVSHAIHTPVQAGPYRPGRPFWDDPEYALQQTISSFTHYYEIAVGKGHVPTASWLVDY